MSVKAKRFGARRKDGYNYARARRKMWNIASVPEDK